ncbi:exosortase system-associated protein, TIGR04073 family [Methylogaea oryzae]|uniref:Exosortase system-associated protein, TIGR04073 family n=1 Tax=Methylogaea oryzae TaxID=1295382 RepID=A0A8D5ANU7_9GAMM|nr:exosortase system-associated protein, TIGR04073 family [Methylogaea oryzae]BBL72450.1 hypothetical protein MoryE10_30560 [Methylogaea oryzae]
MAKPYGWLLLLGCLSAAGAAEAEGYLDAVTDKALRGAGNIAYGWMEIPKNMVNEVDRNGVLYVPVGLGKGLLYMAGRALIGVADLATLPLPSAPLAQPPLAWNLTDRETRFFGQDDAR